MKTTSSGTRLGARRLFGNAFIAIGGAAAVLLLAGIAGLAWAWISAAPAPACAAEMGREAKMECLRQHGR